jgi:serine/threonine protein kinase/formylglycine-generating enzyme required for sulfatase activity
MIGSQISHYRLVRKLGAGTYGEVYEGVHVHDEELRVAIKIVSPSLVQDARFVDALKRECRQLDKMRHPNIVTFRDLVVQGDQVAMLLELLRGQDLHDRLAGGPLAVDTAASVLEAMLEGLAYAHASGVLHRDIKPGNVYWCDDGRIVILDFGIARAADGTQATKTGHMVGTFDYMAPERMSGSGGTASSDVYAVGLLAWELLAGRAACPEGEVARKLIWHMMEGVGDPAKVAATLGCPPWFADVIATLAAKDSAARPADGHAALALLREKRAAADATPASAPAARRPPPSTVMGPSPVGSVPPVAASVPPVSVPPMSTGRSAPPGTVMGPAPAPSAPPSSGRSTPPGTVMGPAPSALPPPSVPVMTSPPPRPPPSVANPPQVSVVVDAPAPMPVPNQDAGPASGVHASPVEATVGDADLVPAAREAQGRDPLVIVSGGWVVASALAGLATPIGWWTTAALTPALLCAAPLLSVATAVVGARAARARGTAGPFAACLVPAAYALVERSRFPSRIAVAAVATLAPLIALAAIRSETSVVGEWSGTYRFGEETLGTLPFDFEAYPDGRPGLMVTSVYDDKAYGSVPLAIGDTILSIDGKTVQTTAPEGHSLSEQFAGAVGSVTHLVVEGPRVGNASGTPGPRDVELRRCTDELIFDEVKCDPAQLPIASISLSVREGPDGYLCGGTITFDGRQVVSTSLFPCRLARDWPWSTSRIVGDVHPEIEWDAPEGMEMLQAFELRRSAPDALGVHLVTAEADVNDLDLLFPSLLKMSRQNGPPVEMPMFALPDRSPRANPPAPRSTDATVDLGGPYGMVRVAAGSYTIGQRAGERSPDGGEGNGPRDYVIEAPLLVGATEVTIGQWNAVMRDVTLPSNGVQANCERGSDGGYGDRAPIRCVSAFDAALFANRLSLREGLEQCYALEAYGDPATGAITEYAALTWSDRRCAGYRLPTEGEWEVAARAGGAHRYAASNDWKQVAWFKDNATGHVHAPMELWPNDWGLYDMSGNVGELTWSETSGDDCHAVTMGGSISSTDHLVWERWSLFRDTTRGEESGIRLVRQQWPAAPAPMEAPAVP